MEHNGETNGLTDRINEDEADLTLEQAIEEYSHEYHNINNTLDHLDSCLDSIEHQNDQLNTKILELLHSNRLLREELQTEIAAKQQPSDSEANMESDENNCDAADMSNKEDEKQNST